MLQHLEPRPCVSGEPTIFDESESVLGDEPRTEFREETLDESRTEITRVPDSPVYTESSAYTLVCPCNENCE